MSARGSVSILMVAGAALLSLSSLAVADVGSMLLARGRAQQAADAAALAAVARQAPVLRQGDDPSGAAREVAERNGATLVSCACDVGTSDATVEVEVTPRLGFLSGWYGRRARARARAHLDDDVLTYRDGSSERGVQVRRMCHARGMSKTIQVRNVPERLHRELKRRARARSQTLIDYIEQILEREVARPPADEVFDRIEARPPVRLPPGGGLDWSAKDARNGRNVGSGS